jgi:hypothetical protein
MFLNFLLSHLKNNIHFLSFFFLIKSVILSDNFNHFSEPKIAKILGKCVFFSTVNLTNFPNLWKDLPNPIY